MEQPSTAAQRRAKLARLREAGPAYPNDFSRTHMTGQLAKQHDAAGAEELEKLQAIATIAGRIVRRQAGDAETLGVIEDGSGAIQVCVSDAAAGASNHAAFRDWDLGDIVGVMGILYRSGGGELTLRAHELRLLVKSLRPVPDQQAVRRLVPLRSRLLAGIRDFMRGTQYIEVETPLLHPAPDAAGATPALQTYHHALELKLYLRSAAGLYLQRLVIGGIEKVYEINRSFRADAAQRSPEGTSMEIYCAYANHLYMMSLLERVTAHATMHALGTTQARHGGMQIDFGAPFAQITCAQALGKILVAPTFVVDSPARAAPGARRKNDDPTLAEHFTLFAGGEPIAEGLSLLNDPEAHATCDADFIRALEYGMPPTSGARLDIDRWMAVLAGESDARPC